MVWATPAVWHLVNMVEKGSMLFLAIGLLNPYKISFVSTSNWCQGNILKAVLK